MSKSEEWKAWEGRMVDGKFPLRRWLGGSDHSAVFSTEKPGQASQGAVIKLIAADTPEADRQLPHWRSAAQLSHPHLMQVFETGRSRVNGTPILYAVMEAADEDLSQILPQRPLAPAEAAELLPPLLDALSYLHSKGFVHSRIKPSNVLAVNDQLKLSSDQVAPISDASSARRRRDAFDAPETAAGIVSPAGDVWSVGATLVAGLTQNVSFAGETTPTDPTLPETLPEPFRGIARECLHLDPKRRCSIAQIQARLHPTARSVPAEPEAPPAPRRAVNRKPIYAGLLVVLVLVGLFVYYSRGKSPAVQTSETAQQPAAQTPAQQSPAPVSAPRQREATPTAKKVATSQGEVIHQVLPEPSHSARNTITGTVKVTVRVDVDSSGKVTSAKFASAGPSKYFANLALKAAERWEFSAPEVDGKPAASAWRLQFRFRRDSTKVVPERVSR